MKKSLKFVSALLAVMTAMLMMSFSSLAADAPAAPAKVWYKLINHDKVALKWDAVSWAEKYYLYLLNSETGKYGKVGSVTKTNCTLKKLQPDTEYTYAVRAVGKSGSSKLRPVTFTTPEEWYYEIKQGPTRNHVYRQHYDGSGRETFNEYELIGIAEAAANGEDISADSINVRSVEESYNIMSVEQYFGYVYFRVQYYNIVDAAEYDFYRMKNDGTEFTAFGSVITGSVYDKSSYFTDADNMYLYRDSCISNGLFIILTNAGVSKTGIQDGEPTRIRNIWNAEKSCISNIVSDGEYLYWVASPYRSYVDSRLYEYLEEESDKTPNTSTTAYLWRAKIGEPTWTVTYNEEGLMRTKETGEKPSNIAEFTFKSDSLEDSLTAIGCHNGYLYYYVQEDVPEDYDEDEESENTFRFYRISLTDKNAKPQKLFRSRSWCVNAFLYNGKIVLTENEGSKKPGKCSYNIYTYNLKAAKPTINKIRHFDLFSGDRTENIVFDDFEVTNGYIYFSAFDSTFKLLDDELRYYRVKLDGASASKSTKPFLWR